MDKLAAVSDTGFPTRCTYAVSGDRNMGSLILGELRIAGDSVDGPLARDVVGETGALAEVADGVGDGGIGRVACASVVRDLRKHSHCRANCQGSGQETDDGVEKLHSDGK